jgi:hypothetical protein
MPVLTTVSARLSTHWTFNVVKTSMPAMIGSSAGVVSPLRWFYPRAGVGYLLDRGRRIRGAINAVS